MGQIRTRPLETVRFDANNIVPYKIQSGKVCYGLTLSLVGAITCTDVNNTAANARRGDEWGLIRRIQLKTDKEEWNISGDELWWLNRHWFGKNPNISPQLGAGTGTPNPNFANTLVMPFFLPRSERPHDTLINMGRYENPELTVTWGTFTDINSAATGFTTTPTLRVQITEDEERRQEQFWRRYVVRRETDPAGSNANFYHPLAVDRNYRRIFLNTRNSAGVDVGTLLNRLELFSGSVKYIDTPYSDYRESIDLMAQSPDQFVRAATLAGTYERARQNLINQIDGWATIDLALDGSMRSGPDTYGLSQFGINFDVTAAGKIVTIEETVEVPRGSPATSA